MSKVFISYGSKNRKVAEGLCAHLEAHGIPCWMAPRDISSGVYAGEITRAIKAADVFIVICSKETRESDHVKNEVNLAVNNAGLILPYCLDDTPFDDDLEYYLSSKQRIISGGVLEKDFQRIEGIIRDYRGEEAVAAATPAPQSPRKRSLLLSLLCVAILVVAAGVFFWRQGRQGQSPEENPAIPTNSLTIDETIVRESPTEPIVELTVKPMKSIGPVDPNANTFNGKIVDGYPDGYGTYTFKTRRRIDMHDVEARFAEPGDYIIGTWTRGHLNMGEWYGPDDIMKDYIQLGENPDFAKDQQLGKCVKP